MSYDGILWLFPKVSGPVLCLSLVSVSQRPCWTCFYIATVTLDSNRVSKMNRLHIVWLKPFILKVFCTCLWASNLWLFLPFSLTTFPVYDRYRCLELHNCFRFLSWYLPCGLSFVLPLVISASFHSPVASILLLVLVVFSYISSNCSLKWTIVLFVMSPTPSFIPSSIASLSLHSFTHVQLVLRWRTLFLTCLMAQQQCHRPILQRVLHKQSCHLLRHYWYRQYFQCLSFRSP